MLARISFALNLQVSTANKRDDQRRIDNKTRILVLVTRVTPRIPTKVGTYPRIFLMPLPGHRITAYNPSTVAAH